jgi:uncharacterized protein YutE (UPF0331/DUF86 family)
VTEPEDDILEAIAERIRSLVIALDEDAQALGPVPADLAAFEAMTLQSRVGSRALLKTVEQLEDQMMRLFRTILRMRDVDTSTMYARDVANRMEAAGIVAGTDEWMQIVKLRNRLVHDYPLSRESQFTKLVEAVAAAAVLRASAERALAYIDTKEWLA